MKNLLWKDFWQNSRVLLAIAIVAACPYVVVLAITTGEIIVHKYNGLVISAACGDSLIGMFMGASMGSLILSVLLAAFVGGNAIAGERADRSAEFVACMPISRGKSVASKAIVAAGACLAMWAVNAAIIAVTWSVAHLGRPFFWSDPRHEASFVMMYSLGGIVLLFGLAWLYSSLLSSPAISAAAAIGTAIVLVVIVQTICSYLYHDPFSRFVWFFLLCYLAPIIAVLSFTAGVTICLRRNEP